MVIDFHQFSLNKRYVSHKTEEYIGMYETQLVYCVIKKTHVKPKEIHMVSIEECNLPYFFPNDILVINISLYH